MAESIRTFGDPVLKTKAQPVDDIDGKARRLVDKMFGALYGTENGLALAAPHIGVQKQVVVWPSASVCRHWMPFQLRAPLASDSATFLKPPT